MVEPPPLVLLEPGPVQAIGLAIVGVVAGAGALLGWLVTADGDALVGGGVGYGAGLVASLLFSVTRGSAMWRRLTAERLGLEGVPLDAFSFVLFLPEPPRVFRSSGDVGLLAETEAGLVFLGARGGRSVVPCSDIARARVEPLPRGSAPCVRLDLRDGSTRWIACRDKPSFWGAHRGLAEALAARIRQRVR